MPESRRWMKKRQLIRDTGGDGNFGAGKLVKRESCRSMRCDSCGKLSYLTAGQTSRRAMPKCDACGGYLSDTKATDNRLGQPAKLLKALNELRRLCWRCNKPLSRYNESDTCAQCSAGIKEKCKKVKESLKEGGDEKQLQVH